MKQQILAVMIIGYFIARLFWQKRKNAITANEFAFWLIFWFLSILAIVFLRSLDLLTSKLGFTASGIDVLLYLGVAFLFYLMFRIRLRLEKTEKNITMIIRALSLDDIDKNEKKNK